MSQNTYKGKKVTKLSSHQAISMLESSQYIKSFNVDNAIKAIELAEQNNEDLLVIEDNKSIELNTFTRLSKSNNEDAYFFSTFAVLVLVLYGVAAKELTNLTVMMDSILVVFSLFLCGYFVLEALKAFQFNTYMIKQKNKLSNYEEGKDSKQLKCSISNDWVLN